MNKGKLIIYFTINLTKFTNKQDDKAKLLDL